MRSTPTFVSSWTRSPRSESESVSLCAGTSRILSAVLAEAFVSTELEAFEQPGGSRATSGSPRGSGLASQLYFSHGSFSPSSPCSLGNDSPRTGSGFEDSGLLT